MNRVLNSSQRSLEDIRHVLDTIGDPCSVANGVPMGLQEMGLVRDVQIDACGDVVIELRLTSPTCMMVGYFDVEVKNRVEQVPWVRSVQVVVDQGLDWSPSMMSEEAKDRRRESLHLRGFPLRGVGR
jgi:metal-sulfur cluster biosynthetic enzyme